MTAYYIGQHEIDDEAAFAVEKLTAGSEDWDFTDTVGFCESVVILAADHLKPPQPEDENRHDGRDDVLDDGEAKGGQFFVAVDHG